MTWNSRVGLSHGLKPEHRLQILFNNTVKKYQVLIMARAPGSPPVLV